MLVIPQPAPVRWMDLDFLRYALGFPQVEVHLAEDGRWSLALIATCSKLDGATNLCTVHGTPAQPRTCAYFNPHHCWYKRNFTGGAEADPPEVLRLDLARFERMLALIGFDTAGNIASWPGWRKVKEALAPPAPTTAPIDPP
jgi:hypothetical protein